MFKKTIHSLILSRRKEIPFIIMLSFLVTFSITRLWIYTIYEYQWERIFFFYIQIEGVEYHVHHLSYGIVGLSIIGFLSIAVPKLTQKFSHIFAIFYGVFLALILDETALWVLDLDIKYNHRLSTDAIIIALSIFLLVIYSPPFWKWIRRKIKRECSQLNQNELPIKFR